VEELRAEEEYSAVNDLDVIYVGNQRSLEGYRIKAIAPDQGVVRIHHQGIIDIRHAAKCFESKGAVVGKIPPRLVDDFARHALLLQIAASQVLGSVTGACVNDQHVVDKRKRAGQAVENDLRLVLDDHAKTNFFHFYSSSKITR